MAHPDEALQADRLRRFLRVLRATLFVFGAFTLTGSLVVVNRKLVTFAVVVLAYFASTFAAQRLAKNRRVTCAASIAAYGALALALTAGLQFPYGDAAVIVAALLAVTIALPYLEGAHLGWFLVANYAVVVAVLYRGFQPDPHLGLPFWLEFSVVVGGGALGAYLLLFLLWQFTERLRHTLERTRRAHREAESARQSASFLAEASRRLGVSSLDYLATLRSVAELAVPALADCCLIDDLDGDGILQKVDAAHADPSLRGLLERLQDSYATTALHPAGPVMRTLRPILLREVDEHRLRTLARTPEQIDMIRRLGPRSVIIVPLVARGRPLGSMCLARTSASPRYDEHDLALVEELAYRAALSADNARLYAEAQTAVRARDEFLSIASHELRTPLTPLSLQIQALRRHLPDLATGTISIDWLEHRLNVINRQSERLARLIDELLDISRLVAGRFRLELEPVDLTELVRDLAERFQWAGGNHVATVRLELVLAERVEGRWDRLRLEQVLTNLMSNAIKYGAERPIEVAMVSNGKTATLAVTDHGIGIAQHDQRRIFDRFERASSATHLAGLGLGLFITRQIVEALGGTIRVSSELGKGSTFTVELPLAGPPAVQAMPSQLQA